jgi:hypothetical protein
VICFVHIEKAAGTTLHYVFRHNHPVRYVVMPALDALTNQPRAVWSASELRVFSRMYPRLWGFGGHAVRSYLGYADIVGEPLRYLTFLRDPIGRYISHFKHLRRVKGPSITLEGYLGEKLFSDFMTTRIAGRPDLDAAMRRLEEDFAFVGLTDRFDEGLVLLKRALGLDGLCLNYEQLNVTEEKEKAAGVRVAEPWKTDPALRARIAAENTLDVQLYAWARDVLWPRQVATFGQGLEAAVAELRKGNESFHFRRRDFLEAQSTWWLYGRHLQRASRLVGRRVLGPREPEAPPVFPAASADLFER